MTILETKNLSFEYEAGNRVLDNINLKFEEGKTYAIIGKSGSGKTTLISLLSGLDKVVLGDVWFEGQSLKSKNLDEYRANSVGIIFQQYNLLNNYTVLDNLLIAMKISAKPISIDRAQELIKLVGLDQSVLDKKPLELSGGQQQRVAIARTLAKDTKVIIGDEPTGNLDKETEEEILNLLKEIVKKQNKTLIMVTHSHFISGSAEHVYGITNGTINTIK